MNLKERRHYFVSALVFKCVNCTAPFYLCHVLTPAASIHTRVNIVYCLLVVHKSITNMQRGARVNKNNGHSPYH